MSEELSRTELLYGKEAIKKLSSSRIAVFGIGGVGGYVTEALARSGIGALDLIDNDTVALSNINRQIIATHSSVGKYKVDVAAERIKDINPDCRIKVFKLFFLPDDQGDINFKDYDYIVDAVDTVTAKLTIIENAKKAGVPVISSMGTGNKLDPSSLKISDLYNTSVCPLAKVMRRECRKRGIDSLKVVYSEEEPRKPMENSPTDPVRRSIPGSTSFVPPTAGLMIAGEVIINLIGINGKI